MAHLNYTVYPKNIDYKPSVMMVLIHGYGSNANDLITLAPDLMPHLNSAVIISPSAPFKHEGGGGSGAYQWYSLLDRSPKAMLEGYGKAEVILHQFLEAKLKEYNLTFSDLILGGFSQGGMMALQYGTHSQQPLKGVISCSGYIVDDGAFGKGINNKTPVLMTHGDQDGVVPPFAYHTSKEKLMSLGINVTGHLAKGVTHGIDYGCLTAIQNFLKKL